MKTLRHWSIRAACPACGGPLPELIGMEEQYYDQGAAGGEFTTVSPYVDMSSGPFYCKACDVRHDTRLLTFTLVEEKP